MLSAHQASRNTTGSVNQQPLHHTQQLASAQAVTLLEALRQHLPTHVLPAVFGSPADDIAAAARAGRAADLPSLFEGAAAGVYAATPDPLNAVAEDVRGMAGTMRAAVRRGCVPLEDTFEELGEEAPNALEDTLDACLVAMANPAASGSADASADVKAQGGQPARETLAEMRAALAPHQELEDPQHIESTVAEQLCRSAHGLGEAGSAGLEQLRSCEALAHALATTEAGCAAAQVFRDRLMCRALTIAAARCRASCRCCAGRSRATARRRGSCAVCLLQAPLFPAFCPVMGCASALHVQ